MAHLCLRHPRQGRTVSSPARLKSSSIAYLQQPGQVNITYGVYPAWRKRGVASNAVELACEFVRVQGAQQAIIRAEPGNEASQAVAQNSDATGAGRG